MRVCMEIGSGHTTDQDTRGREETTEKGRNTGKPEYTGMIAANGKSIKKS